MTTRLNPFVAAPDLMKSWLEWSRTTLTAGLEPSLVELVKIRASQLNACAFCLNMHTVEARKAGEMEERLYLLNAWRETPLYTAREQAALAWTEALTLLPNTNAPDDVYAQVTREFSEQEQVALTLLIVAINGWNRVQVGFRAVPQVTSAQQAA